MVHGISFRLVYRVVFVCIFFVCLYHGGGSGHDRHDKAKERVNGKPSNEDLLLVQDKYVHDATENAKFQKSEKFNIICASK